MDLITQAIRILLDLNWKLNLAREFQDSKNILGLIGMVLLGFTACSMIYGAWKFRKDGVKFSFRELLGLKRK